MFRFFIASPVTRVRTFPICRHRQIGYPITSFARKAGFSKILSNNRRLGHTYFVEKMWKICINGGEDGGLLRGPDPYCSGSRSSNDFYLSDLLPLHIGFEF